MTDRFRESRQTSPDAKVLCVSRKPSVDREPDSTVIINHSYLDTSEDMIHVRIDQINSTLDQPYIETTIEKTLEFTNELKQLKKQLRQCQEDEQMLSMLIKDDSEPIKSSD